MHWIDCDLAVWQQAGVFVDFVGRLRIAAAIAPVELAISLQGFLGFRHAEPCLGGLLLESWGFLFGSPIFDIQARSSPCPVLVERLGFDHDFHLGFGCRGGFFLLGGAGLDLCAGHL